jgi:hypothetical protein
VGSLDSSGGEGVVTAAVAAPRVFISYAHESEAHEALVRDLWILLRRLGVDAKLDLTAAERRRDWPVWMLGEVRAADFVLVIASAAYRRRAEGDAEADEGRGVQFEAVLIREEMYRDRARGVGSSCRWCCRNSLSTGSRCFCRRRRQPPIGWRRSAHRRQSGCFAC